MSKDPKKQSFLSLFEELNHHPSGCGCPSHSEKNGHSYPGMDEDDDSFEDENEDSDEWYDADEEEIDEGSLTDALDHEILMHRDAHFAGDFAVMIQYYEKNGVGISPDIEIDRLEYLAQIENERGVNLAAEILSGIEAERVGRAREAYRKLKEAYEEEVFENVNSRLIAELVLSEEEIPSQEIEAIVEQGSAIVPALIELLKTEEAYDPLFPGYGLAPYLAIECLGKIADPQAVVPLFECLGKEMVFDEEIVLESLQNIGEPAKQFLIKVIKSRPITQDNLQAAYALLAFQDDQEVALAAFEQIQDPHVQKNHLLMHFLLSDCWSLKFTDQKPLFANFVKRYQGDDDILKVMESMLKEWDKERN